MIRNINLGLLILIISFSACKKDDIDNSDQQVDSLNSKIAGFDTIRPLEYFPSYPSSYWVYNNTDTVKVYDDYQLYIPKDSNNLDFEGAFLPKLEPNDIYGENFIYEYSIPYYMDNIFYNGIRFCNFLSEKLDSHYLIKYISSSRDISGTTTVVDTTITVKGVEYNDVIMTIHYNGIGVSYEGFYIDEIMESREFYAKGVGLIKKDKNLGDFDEIEWEPIYELTSYHINK